jgi:hypothetical protein
MVRLLARTRDFLRHVSLISAPIFLLAVTYGGVERVQHFLSPLTGLAVEHEHCYTLILRPVPRIVLHRLMSFLHQAPKPMVLLIC